MSCYMVDKRLIDGLLTYGLARHAINGPLRWYDPAMYRTEEYERAFQTGEPWGDIAAVEPFRHELTPETAGRVGAMLWAENRRSVDFRYAEEEIEEAYVYEAFPRATGRVLSISAGLAPVPDYELTAIQILDGLDCYEYQACECPDWRFSEAYAFCEALCHRAISALPRTHEAGWWHDRETAW